MTLKKDRLIKGASGAGLGQRIDEELDGLLDENVRLREEESLLMEKFKTMKKRHDATRRIASPKKLRSTMDASPTRRADFTVELQTLRENIEKSNKNIAQLKTEVEFTKKATHG